MISEIRENPTFLRYYEIWRKNPSSVVFAPLAEMLMLHKCYEEAITVCRKGLEKNPDFVSGRLALIRAYIGVSNFKRAGEEVQSVLNRYKDHPEALEFLENIREHTDKIVGEKKISKRTVKKHEEELLPSELDPTKDVRWNTVTMAEIFALQGDVKMARKIYNNVLEKEPGNTLAREGIEKLDGMREVWKS